MSEISILRGHTEQLLAHPWEAFPICIPSYKRWDRDANRTLTKVIEPCSDDLKNNVFVFVRGEQADQYKQSYPWAHLVELPPVNGLAGTRQYIQDYVLDILGEPYFIDMDDDIQSLHYVHYKGAGKDAIAWLKDTSFEQVIRYSCAIARMAFEVDDCVLGNLHRRRFAQTAQGGINPSQVAYQVNRGSTPRQVLFTNAAKLRELGIERNLAFDETGDDMGFVAEIAQKGLNMFQIRSLAYEFVDDAINSVIRNDDNRRRLAAQEHELLLQYPIRDYLRISQKFEDGSYRFSDIDFRKYVKEYGLDTPIRTVSEFILWAAEHKL